MSLSTARALSPLLDMTTTRDMIFRGVACELQSELLSTLRTQGAADVKPNPRSVFILGEDTTDVMGAGESGWPADHPSVATLQLGLVGRQALVLPRPYVTPLVVLTARDADVLNLDGFASLDIDPACLAARLVDPEYAPRLKTLIVEGERDEALDACAAERKLAIIYRSVGSIRHCALTAAVLCWARSLQY